MPQSCEALRAEFGVDDGPVIFFLEARGYVHSDDWRWSMPAGRDHPTPKEWRAMRFLIEEWDWGGLTAESVARWNAAAPLSPE